MTDGDDEPIPELMMSTTDLLLPEFDREMASTRKVLERVPEAKSAWKPHPKSFSLGDLAVHVATLPYWGTVTFRDTEFDYTEQVAKELARKFEGTKALLTMFDNNAASARGELLKMTDAGWSVPWTFKYQGQVVFTKPRYETYRTDTLNHLVHHRAQLTVYLRLNDVPLPNLYGPTADER